MFMGQEPQAHTVHVYQRRRNDLLSLLHNSGGQEGSLKGLIVLFADFEQSCTPFFQENSLYYLTGIQEPGVVLTINVVTGESIVYVPQYKTDRTQWVSDALTVSVDVAKSYGVDALVPLGEPIAGYTAAPFFNAVSYALLFKALQETVAMGGTLWSTIPAESINTYVMQRHVIDRINMLVPYVKNSWQDVSGELAQLRRTKDMLEIENIAYAVEITHEALERAIDGIARGGDEAYVHGMVSYAMVSHHASPAYPPIIAGGSRATILHYYKNDKQINAGELILLDIGARYNYYCADITRTYPVSGKFTTRQRECYALVLATQEYIADLAAPGMYLRSEQFPEKSLHHLAKKFLAERGGYDNYFIHGIGHFLGMDVHDVGDGNVPLQEGDVITIEPGIYIPQEGIGIRIEDNYWIVRGGAICLSEAIPKKIDDIEQIMSDRLALEKEATVDTDEESGAYEFSYEESEEGDTDYLEDIQN